MKRCILIVGKVEEEAISVNNAELEVTLLRRARDGLLSPSEAYLLQYIAFLLDKVQAASIVASLLLKIKPRDRLSVQNWASVRGVAGPQR